MIEFAARLEHPQWLHVLPNGDVLVAEAAAPPQPELGGGISGLILAETMKEAGAAVPSADRITLLRDSDCDGIADPRTAFLTGLKSPIGMALVGSDLYVANTAFRTAVTKSSSCRSRMGDRTALRSTC